MKTFEERRERYLRFSMERRVGNLATNVNRLGIYLNTDHSSEDTVYLLRETQYLLDWTSLELNFESKVELLELQRQLSRWKLNWDSIWTNELERQKVQIQARAWAEKLLGWMEDMQARAELEVKP
jgi:hypothetical protein